MCACMFSKLQQPKLNREEFHYFSPRDSPREVNDTKGEEEKEMDIDKCLGF
jgi:hypothetical protein